MQRIETFAGDQFAPGDAGYDEARSVFNAMVDRRPARIARCTGTDDVVRALDHAEREGLEVAVRAGGHSVAGMSLNDGGLVIDLRDLTSVAVDPDRRIARAGGGATWADFDTATQEHGLATTGGRVSTTGVAGLTLGGGSGWLERSLGLACDNLVGAQLVTSRGEVVNVDAREDPDLLWALRGGGGNFGVVTELEFVLHDVGPLVFGGLAAYDPVHGPELMRAMRDFMSNAPDASGLALGYVTAPPEAFIPQEWQGRRVFALVGLWHGPVDEGERALRPLLDLAPTIADLFGPIPYSELQRMIDDPPGFRNWWTADYLSELPDDAIDAFAAYSEAMPQSLTQLLMVPWGGAVARSGDETPLAKRDAAWVIHPFAVWEGAERDAEHITWGRRSHELFAPWTTGGTYLNFIGDEGADRVRAAFGSAYDRLVAVKTRWDPDNVFHGNQNIPPRRQAVAAG